MAAPLNVGIAYNAFEPDVPVNERRSEEAVGEVAVDVYKTLREAGFNATIFPLRRSVFSFMRRVKSRNVDVLINLCEAFFGKPEWEANVAAVFEMLGIPFTGSGFRTLALCQDKARSKAVLQAHGLPVAPSRLVGSPDEPVDLPFPLFVKPNMEDASLGIYPESVVRDAESLKLQVKRIVETYNQPALVETYIEGREFNVAVLDNGRVHALPVSEIDFSGMPEDTPNICSYTAKWFVDDPLCIHTVPVCPAPVSPELDARLRDTAVAAFRAMDCLDYARIDFRMDGTGRIYVLEVNPNPDTSLDAGYVRALGAAGISYIEFWTGMIENALKRKTHDSST